MDIQIRNFNARHVASVRHMGPYDKCDPAWSTLCEWAAPKGFLGGQTGFIGLCYDDPENTPTDKIRYDACITVDQKVTTDGNISVQDVEAGDYAVVTYKGNYSGLKDIYGNIFNTWLPASGREHRTGTPCVEVYLTDPKTTPADENITEVQVPLK